MTTKYSYAALFLLLCVGCSLLLGFSEVSAQATCPSNTICNPLQATSISGFFRDLFRSAVKIGLPIVVLFIVYAGFKFISAQGNSEKLNEAKQNFLYVILGTTIFLGAWVIAEIIAATLKQLGV